MTTARNSQGRKVVTYETITNYRTEEDKNKIADDRLARDARDWGDVKRNRKARDLDMVATLREEMVEKMHLNGALEVTANREAKKAKREHERAAVIRNAFV